MPFNALAQEKILDFEALGIPEVFDRDLRLAPIQKPERNNLAQVIVGTRRCSPMSSTRFSRCAPMRAKRDASFFFDEIQEVPIGVYFFVA